MLKSEIDGFLLTVFFYFDTLVHVNKS